MVQFNVFIKLTMLYFLLSRLLVNQRPKIVGPALPVCTAGVAAPGAQSLSSTQTPYPQQVPTAQM